MRHISGAHKSGVLTKMNLMHTRFSKGLTGRFRYENKFHKNTTVLDIGNKRELDKTLILTPLEKEHMKKVMG